MALDFVAEGPTAEDPWGNPPAAFAGLVKAPAPLETDVPDAPAPADVMAEVITVGPTPAETPAPMGEAFRSEYASEPPPAPPAPPSVDSVATLVQLFAPLLTPHQTAGFTHQLTLEQSAAQLLTLLDERYQQVLREQALNTSTSLAEVIAGILTLAGDRGALSEFALNPEWREYIHRTGGSPTGATPSLQAKCGHCQQMFRAARSGQRYCCSPCGKRAQGYRETGPDHALDCATPAAQFHQKMLAKVVQPAAQEL